MDSLYLEPEERELYRAEIVDRQTLVVTIQRIIVLGKKRKEYFLKEITRVEVVKSAVFFGVPLLQIYILAYPDYEPPIGRITTQIEIECLTMQQAEEIARLIKLHIPFSPR